MAYVNNWIHCVWGTKNRVPFLNDQLKSDLINHIRTNTKQKGIFIDTINGYSDHIHCLLSLGPDQTLSKTIQLIKGESSFWINKNKLIRYKFAWAVEYYAASVSESHISKVRDYITNQELHHRKIGVKKKSGSYLDTRSQKSFRARARSITPDLSRVTLNPGLQSGDKRIPED
jgi:REP element-mobilizing transposase RayT